MIEPIALLVVDMLRSQHASHWKYAQFRATFYRVARGKWIVFLRCTCQIAYLFLVVLFFALQTYVSMVICLILYYHCDAIFRWARLNTTRRYSLNNITIEHIVDIKEIIIV